jgi:hypothetical protein
MTEQWMSMRTAARRLGVSPNKISRLASKGRITTRENPLDERVRLVDYNELKALFESAPKVVTDKAVARDEGTTKDTGGAGQHPASDPLQ